MILSEQTALGKETEERHGLKEYPNLGQGVATVSPTPPPSGGGRRVYMSALSGDRDSK